MHVSLLHKHGDTCNLKQLVQVCHVCEFDILHKGCFFCGFTGQAELFVIMKFGNFGLFLPKQGVS